jgi:hypothetical protein
VGFRMVLDLYQVLGSFHGSLVRSLGREQL